VKAVNILLVLFNYNHAMRLIILAFIISISLHLLFLNTYKINKEEVKTNTTQKSLKKSDITYVKIKKKEVKKPVEIKKPEVKKVEKKLVKKPEVKPKPKPKPKKVIKKKVVKKKPVNKKQTNYTKKIKPTKKKRVKKVIKQPLQDKILKDQIVNKKSSIQQKTLEDFLSQADPVDKKTLSTIERLYGREFQSFTKVQKAFIKKNLNQFQQITQRVLNRLGYPPLAAKLRIGGTNIVEFMFYPDGSIKKLKITKSSGYDILDKYTIELIEIAYKDYPRPKTATKLKFYVTYRLY